MAEEKRTTIIDFQIQEGDAISSLASTKKSILETKAAQKELNDEFKAGTKNVDDYAKETVQLEAQLKKQQASYSTLQRTVTGLKSPFDKLNESIKEQAKQVTVAGVSLSTFANPATAAIGILGGLFKAYSSSTIGAKDLSFASNQLSAALNQVSNSMASVISGTEDGSGFFSKLAVAFTAAVSGFGVAFDSAAIAAAGERLEDLGRKEISIRNDINERLEENNVLMAKLSEIGVSVEDKLIATNQVVLNLRKNEDELVKVKEEQLSQLEFMLSMDRENERLQQSVLEKEKEISRVKSDIERKVQSILKAEQGVLKEGNKQLEEALEEERAIRHANSEGVIEDETEIENQKVEIKSLAELATFENMQASLKKSKEAYAKHSDDHLKTAIKTQKAETKITELENQNRLATISNTFGQAQGLFEKDTVAYKFLGVARATIDTYRAADLALASIPPPFGAIAAGVNIALGLANVAKILDVGLAAGGGSFMTKGPQLLMVGDNPGGVERVDVTPVSGRGKTVVGKNMVQMAGGGTMFTDASIVANSSQFSPSQQAVTVNMVYSEFREFQEQVLYKEQVAQA